MIQVCNQSCRQAAWKLIKPNIHFRSFNRLPNSRNRTVHHEVLMHLLEKGCAIWSDSLVWMSQMSYKTHFMLHKQFSMFLINNTISVLHLLTATTALEYPQRFIKATLYFRVSAGSCLMYLDSISPTIKCRGQWKYRLAHSSHFPELHTARCAPLADWGDERLLQTAYPHSKWY